jgi:hypothetical protein
LPDFGGTDNDRKFERNKTDGGMLIARPIALKAICSAAGKAFIAGIPEQAVIDAVKKVPRLNENPWKGLLWNSEDGTMFAGKDRLDLAARIFALWMGMDNDTAGIRDELRVVTSGTATLP